MHGQINYLVGGSVFPLRGASWTVLPYIRRYLLLTVKFKEEVHF